LCAAGVTLARDRDRPRRMAGGSIEAFGPFLNLTNRTDFVLVVASLLATLQSAGPYPFYWQYPVSKVGEDPPFKATQSIDRSRPRTGEGNYSHLLACRSGSRTRFASSRAGQLSGTTALHRRCRGICFKQRALSCSTAPRTSSVGFACSALRLPSVVKAEQGRA
jgi:hypothetical protein